MATANPPQTAVAVIDQDPEQGVVEWNLDNWPAEKFNRLIPTQTISVPTDLLRPVVQVVQLNPDPEKGGDVYTSRDMPEGQAAPTKVGLRKLATAAGISFTDERRTDDGSDPDVIEVTTRAEMLLPTGQRITAVGTKRVDLNAQKWNSDDHRKKYRSFFLEHVASRAQNRAIRALLSLKGSYPIPIYQRPFAVVSYAPNMNHPEIRTRMIEAMTGSAAALYGSAAAKAIGPGQTINVTPAPEEDPAPAPTPRPGEHLAKAGDQAPVEPAWMRGVVEQPAAAAAARTLPDVIRAQADEGGLKGAATQPQLQKLGEAFVAAGVDGVAVAAGIRVIWPEQNVDALTASQANAILVASDSDPAFADHWNELVA